MKILSLLKIIKEYQVSILIVFIIASILYGIHMFRYEYVVDEVRSFKILRVDRITNETCLYVFDAMKSFDMQYGDEFKQIMLCDD